MSAVDSIADNLDEEYYQISPPILESFPKFRPPLNLFYFNEQVAQIQVLKKAGERMDTDFQANLAKLCEQGSVFVSRVDYPIYSKHISKQLDLVLADKHLKEHEIAEIFKYALTKRLSEFFSQPVKGMLELLYKDLMVLTEYLWGDLTRIRSMIMRLYREHDLTKHSFNSGMFGLWLFEKVYPGGLKREVYDRVTLSLFLHDIGMSKIALFILEKTKNLIPQERQKIYSHPILGMEIVEKLGLNFEEIKQAIMEHHERLDGNGYPNRSTKISPLGRIAAVADSFCAMITKRPYSEAKTVEQAAKELAAQKSKYDPKVVSHLLTSLSSGGVLTKIPPPEQAEAKKT